MPTNTGNPEGQPNASLGAEDVLGWLRANPEFLTAHAEEICTILPGRFEGDDKVADLQDFALKRLRSEISRKDSMETRLLDAARENAAVQERVQKAVLAVIAAKSMDDLVAVITEKIPELFGIEAALLLMEAGSGPARQEEKIVLQSGADVDQSCFGGMGQTMQSAATLLLDTGAIRPQTILVLGAADPETFAPGQGTDMLAFFATVVEACLSRWLTEKQT